MEATVKVRTGTLETNILSKNLQHYLDLGWVIVEVEEKVMPKDYDDYTVAQLKSICKNRNILPHKEDKKADIINRLIKQDEQSSLIEKPSNKGFTDNLIIE